jgi:hypothetical protein
LVRSLAANYPTTIARPEEIRVFRLTPKVIFFSIARTGFDHMDLVMLEAHVNQRSGAPPAKRQRDGCGEATETPLFRKHM